MFKIVVLVLFLTFVACDRSSRRFSKRVKTSINRHRHSTKVIINKPSLILLPPQFDTIEPINVTESSLSDSFKELILPPFNILLPPYLDVNELKNEDVFYDVKNTTDFPSKILNITDLAFFISDLFDITTAIPVTTVKTETTTHNNTLDTKILIAEETGDFRNTLLPQDEKNYYDNNDYDEPPTTKKPRNKSKNNKYSKQCGNRLGYVADVSNGCQTFYICTEHGIIEPMSCPNGTLFSQDFLVCDWWYNVECV